MGEKGKPIDAEGMVAELKHKAIMSDCWCPNARAATVISGLAAENKRLREALSQIAADADQYRIGYERNGPGFTSPGGSQYEEASYVLDKTQELVEACNAALVG